MAPSLNLILAMLEGRTIKEKRSELICEEDTGVKYFHIHISSGKDPNLKRENPLIFRLTIDWIKILQV